MKNYDVKFEVLGEVRMGSPYNVANVILSGDYCPELPSGEFQDKSLVSSDGLVCYLVQWAVKESSPGFIIWKIDARTKNISKSGRILGCCDNMNIINEQLVVKIWIWDFEKKKVITKDQSIAL